MHSISDNLYNSFITLLHLNQNRIASGRKNVLANSVRCLLQVKLIIKNSNPINMILGLQVALAEEIKSLHGVVCGCTVGYVCSDCTHNNQQWPVCTHYDYMNVKCGCGTCEGVQSTSFSNSPYLEGNKCVYQCSSGFYKLDQYQNKYCTDKCDDKQFAETPDSHGMRQCVNECKTNAYTVIMKSNISYRQCTNDSDCGYYVSEQLDISGKESKQTYLHCYVDSCPSSYKFHNNNSHECKQDCGGQPYIPGTSENICVERCSDTELKYTDVDMCVSTCASGHFVTNGTQKLCVDECPSDIPFTSSGKCVSACPALEFLQQDSETCAANCSSSAFRTEKIGNTEHNVCVTNDAESCPYYTAETNGYNHCFDTCPHEAPKQTNRLCESCNTDLGGVFWDGLVCVPVCPDERPLYDVANICSKCPTKTFYYASANECRNTCPEDAPSHDSFMICRKCDVVSPTTPFWNPNILSPMCVATCPIDAPAHDDMDVCRTCEAIYGQNGPRLWNGEKCLKQCADETVIPLNGTPLCVRACGLYEEPRLMEGNPNKQCVCKDGFQFNATTKVCTPDETHSWEDLQGACTTENRSTSLLYTQCTLSCAENETSANNHCSCAEGFALSENRSCCVSKAEANCPRTFDINDSIPRGETCIANTTCDPATYKLALDGKKCVTTCKLWFQDENSKELHCAEKCPAWWYTEKDGFCENKAWHRSVAIFGIVSIVLIILLVVLGTVLWRCGKCSRKRKSGKYELICSMPTVEALPCTDLISASAI